MLCPLPQTALTSRSISPSSALPGDALNSVVDPSFSEKATTLSTKEPSSVGFPTLPIKYAVFYIKQQLIVILCRRNSIFEHVTLWFSCEKQPTKKVQIYRKYWVCILMTCELQLVELIICRVMNFLKMVGSWNIRQPVDQGVIMQTLEGHAA